MTKRRLLIIGGKVYGGGPRPLDTRTPAERNKQLAELIEHLKSFREPATLKLIMRDE